MASYTGGQDFEHCFSPKRRTKSSCPDMTSPSCRARDDDCSTCAPSPAISSGLPSPSPLPKFERLALRPQEALRPKELFSEAPSFWGPGAFGLLDFPEFRHSRTADLESPRPHTQDSFAPIYEEDDGFHTPRVSGPPDTPPRAPRKASAPPLMKVLQANTDSAAMCTALLDLLAEDPEAARYPFFENSMEPPLCCAAKAFCSAEVMRCLLEHGADVNLRDSWGQSPADIISSRIQRSYTACFQAPATVASAMNEAAFAALKVLMDAGAEPPRSIDAEPNVWDSLCWPAF
ncbi:unnamed protein product [Durusdinium trenchii]|uniref:Uncharacterized protein n=2 Tax=Durusdinium trenchii TaxID=1381693 RepID=A0ABP0L434_9DINO